MPKARQEPDCMGGRDYRGQKDTKKGQKARVPEAAREGLNRSLVWGTHVNHTKTADEAAYKQNACQNQGKSQAAWEGLITGAKRTPKRIRKQGFRSRTPGRKSQHGMGESTRNQKYSNCIKMLVNN